MIEMNDLPGEITMTRCTLVKVKRGDLFLVSSAASFAFERLLVAFPFFDRFTIGFVAWGMDTFGFTILDHLSPGVHFRLLPVGFIIVLNVEHHGLDRVIRQFALRVAGTLILGEHPDIPMAILALSVFPFHFPIAERAIRPTQLLRSFASPISLQEFVPLVSLPIILRLCFG